MSKGARHLPLKSFFAVHLVYAGTGLFCSNSMSFLPHVGADAIALLKSTGNKEAQQLVHVALSSIPLCFQLETFITQCAQQRFTFNNVRNSVRAFAATLTLHSKQ